MCSHPREDAHRPCSAATAPLKHNNNIDSNHVYVVVYMCVYIYIYKYTHTCRLCVYMYNTIT